MSKIPFCASWPEKRLFEQRPQGLRPFARGHRGRAACRSARFIASRRLPPYVRRRRGPVHLESLHATPSRLQSSLCGVARLGGSGMKNSTRPSGGRLNRREMRILLAPSTAIFERARRWRSADCRSRACRPWGDERRLMVEPFQRRPFGDDTFYALRIHVLGYHAADHMLDLAAWRRTRPDRVALVGDDGDERKLAKRPSRRRLPPRT